MRDQNAVFGAVVKKGGRLVLGLAGVPCGVVADGNFTAETEERRAADLDARAVQEVRVRPVGCEPSQFVGIVMIAVYKDERTAKTA